MNLRQLKIFTLVAKNESITKTANEIYLAQPAVSLAIAQLEEEYKVKLFNRIKQRIIITEEGKELLKYATSVINEVEKFESKAVNLSLNPQINIASSLTMSESFLPKVLRGYDKLNEGNIHIDVCISPLVEQKVENGDVCFGIVEGLKHSNENIVYESLFTDHLVLVANKDYPIEKEIKIEELLNYPLLVRDKNSGTRQVLDAILKINDIDITPRCETASNYSLLEFVKCNIGVAILSHSVCKELINSGEIKEIKVNGIDFSRQISLIYQKGKTFSESEKRLLNHFKNYQEKLLFAV